MITHSLALLAGFLIGALVFKNNAARGSQIADKGKEILAALKGKIK